MKKIFICFMLLTGLVRADDFLDGTGEQCIYIRQQCGIDSSSSIITNGEITKYIREAYSILTPVMYGKDMIDTVITVSSQNEYSIDSLFLVITDVNWEKLDSLKALLPITSKEIQDKYGAGYTIRDKRSFDGRPSYFRWNKTKLELIPTPYIVGDTIVIKGYGRIDNILTDTLFPSDFQVNYRPVATTYASYKMAVSFGNMPLAEQMWRLLEFQSSALNLSINMFKINVKQ